MVYTENEPVYEIDLYGLTTQRINFSITEIIPGDKKDNKKLAVIYQNKINKPPMGYRPIEVGLSAIENGTRNGFVIYEEIA